ncbi:hypothetical protein NliqN6_0869 [Naganishia liquefaciens]|uniref:Uncharacterized protein n=1 Tax=Naganishia liquefaciens TaxID=104408 RepID=A0A8H3TNQ7_9TREE|nr:hypothetical protein NliqN6_0869 [Naganishia liquefaciens]
MILELIRIDQLNDRENTIARLERENGELVANPGEEIERVAECQEQIDLGSEGAARYLSGRDVPVAVADEPQTSALSANWKTIAEAYQKAEADLALHAFSCAFENLSVTRDLAVGQEADLDSVSQLSNSADRDLATIEIDEKWHVVFKREH